MQPAPQFGDSLLLCSSALEQPLRSLLTECVGRLIESDRGQPHAILLTGSLARGEGFVVRSEAGALLMSDLDLWVVCERPELAMTAAELRAKLRIPNWMSAHIDLANVRKGYFSGLGPTLSAAQMAEAMRVLWQRDAAWGAAPELPSRIDASDSLRLIQNRCGEFLHSRSVAGATELRLRYAQWKFLLDLPLALFAAHGRYCADVSRVQRDLADEAARAGVELAALTARWQIWERARAGELPVEFLPGSADATRLDAMLREWISILYLATLVAEVAPESEHPVSEALGWAAARSADSWPKLSRRWLRRRGVWGTLREARRWAAIGPAVPSPWWRYGLGGSGNERVLWSVAETLVRGESEAARPLVGAAAPDEKELGELWAAWILGSRRA